MKRSTILLLPAVLLSAFVLAGCPAPEDGDNTLDGLKKKSKEVQKGLEMYNVEMMLKGATVPQDSTALVLKTLGDLGIKVVTAEPYDGRQEEFDSTISHTRGDHSFTIEVPNGKTRWISVLWLNGKAGQEVTATCAGGTCSTQSPISRFYQAPTGTPPMPTQPAPILLTPGIWRLTFSFANEGGKMPGVKLLHQERSDGSYSVRVSNSAKSRPVKDDPVTLITIACEDLIM